MQSRGSPEMSRPGPSPSVVAQCGGERERERERAKLYTSNMGEYRKHRRMHTIHCKIFLISMLKQARGL